MLGSASGALLRRCVLARLVSWRMCRLHVLVLVRYAGVMDDRDNRTQLVNLFDSTTP